MKEDLFVEDGLRRGCGRDLFRPQVGRVEVALVSSEVVVDGEAALTEEHIGGVRPVRLNIHTTVTPTCTSSSTMSAVV